MLRTRFKLQIVSLVLLSLGLAPRADEPRFGPAEDSSVTRGIEIELALFFDQVRMRMNGQEMPTPLDELAEGILLEVAMAVTDRFVAAGEGRALELVRTYDALRATGRVRGETATLERSAELVGEPLRFRWSEDVGDYLLACADPGQRVDPQLLVGLLPDMDFTALLPRGVVAADDSWTVSGAGLAGVFMPGGFPLPADTAGVQWSHILADSLAPQLEKILEDLEVVCTYGGSRRVGEQRLAEIAFTFQDTLTLDLSRVLEGVLEMMVEYEDDEARDEEHVELDVRLVIELEGRGLLLWNLALQRAHGFEMSSDMILELSATGHIDSEGEAHALDAELELSGKGTWKMTTD